MRFWYLLHRQASKAQTSLRICRQMRSLVRAFAADIQNKEFAAHVHKEKKQVIHMKAKSFTSSEMFQDITKFVSCYSHDCHLTLCILGTFTFHVFCLFKNFF